MILSRVEIVSFRVIVPFSMSVWALPSHTSVPWDKPEIRSKSANVFGFVSNSMPRTNFVPNSGIPKVPVSQPISSAVTPNASGDSKRDMVAGSPRGTVWGLTPVKS